MSPSLSADHAGNELDSLQRAYLGRARVAINAITFPETEDLDRGKILRLKRVFEIQGCQRLTQTSFIAAEVSQRDFDSCLRHTGLRKADLTSPLHHPPPELRVIRDATVECLFGQHRLFACQDVLPADDQWWIVELYDSCKYDSACTRAMLTAFLLCHSMSDNFSGTQPLTRVL